MCGVEGEEEGNEEAKIAKGKKKEYRPSDKDVEDHMRSGHVPFRSWCRHCIMGRGVDDAHRRVKEDERDIPVISMDYMWLHESAAERKERKKLESEGGERRFIEEMPVLVIKDERSKVILAEVVPRKGLHEHTVEQGVKMVMAFGYERVILKSDQEPSIMAMKGAIRERLRGDVIMEESPVGEHQSNGG